MAIYDGSIAAPRKKPGHDANGKPKPTGAQPQILPCRFTFTVSINSQSAHSDAVNHGDAIDRMMTCFSLGARMISAGTVLAFIIW
jgi:hypothetical protein